MRVLITGAGGFLGRTLAAKLHQQGSKVTAVVRPGRDPELPAGIKLRAVDVRDRNALTAVVREQSPDAVVHLAALKSIRDSHGNEDDYRATNVDSTTNLIDALSTATSPVHVVHASTVSVYGPQQQPNEDAPTDPRNPYARTKLDAETALETAATEGRCHATVLRFANIAGGFGTVHDPNTSAIIPRVLISARNGEAVPVNGAGDSVRDYIHVQDAADAVMAALATPRTFGRFNVGSGQGASVSDIITTAEKVTRRPIAIERKPAVDEVKHIVPDTTRIRQELDWQPQHSALADIITDAWHASGAAQAF